MNPAAQIEKGGFKREKIMTKIEDESY